MGAGSRSLSSMGGVLSAVCGGRGVVGPGHCHLHGQAPVCGCWVSLVGARYRLWGLGVVCGCWVLFVGIVCGCWVICRLWGFACGAHPSVVWDCCWVWGHCWVCDVLSVVMVTWKVVGRGFGQYSHSQNLPASFLRRWLHGWYLGYNIFTYIKAFVVYLVEHLCTILWLCS